jgi:hypothetical protein
MKAQKSSKSRAGIMVLIMHKVSMVKKKRYYPRRDGMYSKYSTPKIKEVFLVQVVHLGCGLSPLASGPSASAAGARAAPARPASSPGSAVVAR